MSEGRIRAVTYESKLANDAQQAGYVLRVKPDDVEALIDQLESTKKTGATVFLSTFENESQFNAGETYLSTTIGVEATQDKGDNKKVGRNQKNAQNRAAMEAEVNNLVGRGRRRK